MRTESEGNRDGLPIEVARQIDSLCDEFERRLEAGDALHFEEILGHVELPHRKALLRELAELAVHASRHRGAEDSWAEVCLANPGLEKELVALREGSRTKTLRHADLLAHAGLRIRCPNCDAKIALVPDADLSSVHCSGCDSHFALAGEGAEGESVASFDRVAHFQLLERVGMGAFGSVWKAHDEELDRVVALKIPRAGAFDDAQQRAFLREARAAAQLKHPGIVPVYEVGRDGDVLYIVSEFVEGRTLAQLLESGPLDARETAEVGRLVAEALHHAHTRGVVHRDLKPGNMMLDDQGRPRLMDFGLAKRDSAEMTVSLEGAILGTPAYMSPEQASGDSQTADARSDVYSLGVVLFEMLTGERPFRGSSRMLLHQVIHDEPPSPRKLNSNVSRDLETITLKCLEKDPDRRYVTAGSVGEELSRWLEGRSIVARPSTAIIRAIRWCRRNPWPAATLNVTVVALLSLSLGAFYYAAKMAERVRIEQNLRIQATDATLHTEEAFDFIGDMLLPQPDDDPFDDALSTFDDAGDFIARLPEIACERLKNQPRALGKVLVKTVDFLEQEHGTSSLLETLDLCVGLTPADLYFTEKELARLQLLHSLAKGKGRKTRDARWNGTWGDRRDEKIKDKSSDWADYDRLRDAESVLGPRHPDVLRAKRWMARHFDASKRVEVTLEVYRHDFLETTSTGAIACRASEAYYRALKAAGRLEDAFEVAEQLWDRLLADPGAPNEALVDSLELLVEATALHLDAERALSRYKSGIEHVRELRTPETRPPWHSPGRRTEARRDPLSLELSLQPIIALFDSKSYGAVPSAVEWGLRDARAEELVPLPVLQDWSRGVSDADSAPISSSDHQLRSKQYENDQLFSRMKSELETWLAAEQIPVRCLGATAVGSLTQRAIEESEYGLAADLIRCTLRCLEENGGDRNIALGLLRSQLAYYLGMAGNNLEASDLLRASENQLAKFKSEWPDLIDASESVSEETPINSLERGYGGFVEQGFGRDSVPGVQEAILRSRRQQLYPRLEFIWGLSLATAQSSCGQPDDAVIQLCDACRDAILTDIRESMYVPTPIRYLLDLQARGAAGAIVQAIVKKPIDGYGSGGIIVGMGAPGDAALRGKLNRVAGLVRRLPTDSRLDSALEAWGLAYMEEQGQFHSAVLDDSSSGSVRSRATSDSLEDPLSNRGELDQLKRYRLDVKKRNKRWIRLVNERLASVDRDLCDAIEECCGKLDDGIGTEAANAVERYIRVLVDD